MYKYLITFTPMESYFFGGERTFGFGRKSVRKPPYYIVSGKKPSQTTLFGTLRYIILSQEKALYGQENEAKAEELVGKESFSFRKALTQPISDEKKSAQDFGIIDSISPLFLLKKGELYVPTPFDHKPGKKKERNIKYTPFDMKETPVTFGNGSVLHSSDYESKKEIPITYEDDFKLYPSNYDAKEGYGGGYVSLTDKKILSDDDIFISDIRTGINFHRTEDTADGVKNDSSFFKKERWILKKIFRLL